MSLKLIRLLDFDFLGTLQLKSLIFNLLIAIPQLSCLLTNLIGLRLKLLYHVLECLLFESFLLKEVILSVGEHLLALDNVLADACVLTSSAIHQSLHMPGLSSRC